MANILGKISWWVERRIKKPLAYAFRSALRRVTVTDYNI